MPKSWEQWLSEVRAYIGERYEKLWSSLQGDPDVTDEFVQFPADWYGRACLGRNLWKPRTRSLRGPSMGFYIEPSARKAEGQDDYVPDGFTSHVEFSVRLPSSDSSRSLLQPDFRTGAAQLIAAQFPAFGDAIAAEPVLYPYERLPASGQIQIVKDLDGWDTDPEGLWISLRAPQPFDYRENARAAPSPKEIADALVPQWDRYVEVVQFLRGYLAKSITPRTKLEALIGFIGEYVAHRGPLAGMDWVGGYADHDFRSSDGVQHFEVKTALGAIPRWPYFTANEIRRGLASSDGQYRLVRVALDRVLFVASFPVLRQLDALPEDRRPGAEADAPWLRRLAEDLKLPEAVVRRRVTQISPLLEQFTGAGSTVEETANPFVGAPLRDLREVASALGAGSIQLWIP